MQTKFNYTYGDEFVLNGNPYTGYYNISDEGIAYTGKYYNESSTELLSPLSEFSSDYARSKYFKDRFPYDVLSLPNELEKILIHPNELVNFNTINTKLSYLHQNIVYLYSKMFMGDTEVPVGFDKTLGNYLQADGTTKFEWSDSAGIIQPIDSNSNYVNFSEFNNIKRFVLIPFNDGSGLSLVGISNTHVIGLTSAYTATGGVSGIDFVMYTNYIDNQSLETFKNLEDITYDGKYLYVSDSVINAGGQVFKYDVNSFFSKDLVFDFKKYLIEPIGGIGGLDRDTKFNKCTILGSKEGEVWIYDSGNDSIKIYDSNFVYKRYIKISGAIKYKILDIRYRKIDNYMYVLYEYTDSNTNQLRFGYFVYNSNYVLTNKVLFNDVLQSESDLRFNRMAMSEQDSNIFYLTTNSTVYKKFFSRPEETNSIFFREKFSTGDSLTFDRTDVIFDTSTYLFNYNESYNFDMQVNDIYILGNNYQNYDDLFLFGNGFISHFKEYTKYDSMLRQIILQYYNSEKIKLESSEYIQSFVMNKEIYKIYFNMVQLKNNLIGKFSFEFDKYGDLKNKDVAYLTDDEMNSLYIDLEYDSFINDNELLNPNVINRIIRDLYKIQSNLLTITKSKILNLKTAVSRDGSNIILIA